MTPKKRRTDQEKTLADLAKAGADVGIWRPADLKSGRIQRELGPVSHA